MWNSTVLLGEELQAHARAVLLNLLAKAPTLFARGRSSEALALLQASSPLIFHRQLGCPCQAFDLLHVRGHLTNASQSQIKDALVQGTECSKLPKQLALRGRLAKALLEKLKITKTTEGCLSLRLRPLPGPAR